MQIEKLEYDNALVVEALEKATESALVVKHPTPGILSLTGKTSLDLLNRMSTNALLEMPPYTVRESVLTTAHARIIDRILVIHLLEEILVIASPHHGEKVHDWLQKHIFFQDDVQISPMSSDWSLWGVYGPDAPLYAASKLPIQSFPDGEGVTSSSGVIIWKTESPTSGLNLLLDPLQEVKLQGASLPAHDPAIATHAYEILRISAGVPLSPNEINENYIPLEVDLWDAVSFSKGCYTGQEIIARMESRGRLARQLIGVQLNDKAPIGSSILHNKRDLGELTSLTYSPHQGWIGLGVLKPIAADIADAKVKIGPDGIEGTIANLARD